MRFLNRFQWVFFTLCAFSGVVNAERVTVDLNPEWKFSLSDIKNAANPDFDDKQWQDVSVPHDWAFNKGIREGGDQGANGGYFDGGVGWYRRSFTADENWLKKRVLLNFDGVYMNSEVWVNGHYLGKKAYGYISFRYDISQFIKAGENNISVRVDNLKEPSARWYHPAGIYAPVSLIIKDAQASINTNGVFVTTQTKNANLAVAKVKVEYSNSRSEAMYVESELIDQAGNSTVYDSQALTACSSKTCVFNTELSIAKPSLWDVETPHLYTLKTTLRSANHVFDSVETRFGIRDIKWDAETGFWINGENTKLKGVSEHWEGGPVGGAWTKPLLRWKLALFKKMGVNAIRTAHNPYPPIFYELCDELGILVMDEIFDGWHKKAPFDYGQQAFDTDWQEDVSEWLTRNRNHPSIILYSVGNETRGEEIGEELVNYVHAIDPTRPVTSGHSASAKMDVFGVNGGSEKTQFFTNQRPNKPFVATEAPHTWQTRGYYRSKTWLRDGNHSERQGIFDLPDLTDKEIFTYEWAAPDKWKNHKQHFNSSYDNATVRISARKNWELMRDLPWFSGHFRWTGFDYYGEAGYVHGGWPFRLFMGGALDVAGFEKDLFYFYKSQWTEEPFVHLLPHWTHPRMQANTEIPVWAYSNCEEVELFLNGQSLGRDNLGTKWDEMQAEWMVPWQEGTLVAHCYIDGKRMATTQQVTAKSPSQLNLQLEDEFLTVDDGAAIITVSLEDKNGIYYPYGENRVYFHIEGSASIRSLENGDPVDTSKNVGINHRKAFMGATRAFLDVPDTKQNLSVISGAILGDKSLFSSNEIHINVKTLTLVGTPKNNNIDIYYTTDGSQPSKLSKKYQGPFKVTPKTEVNATVYVNDNLVFTMRESFADGSGLYWGNADQTVNRSAALGAMPARDAQLKGAIKGKNFVDFKGKEGSITWYQENDGEYGLNQLEFTYALNDKNKRRDMDLIVNGKKIATVKFENTGSWNKKWKKAKLLAPLGAGANYIELRTSGSSGPNIKSLSITPKDNE